MMTSLATNVDYAPYLEGDYSYPLPLPEGPESKLIKWFYNLCGKLWVKIVLVFFLVCSFASLGTGFYYGDQYQRHSVDYYTESYQEFATSLREKGTMTLTLTDALKRPEFFLEDGGKFYSIKGTYSTTDIGSLNAIATYHTDDYRVSYSFSFAKVMSITAYFVDYSKNAYFTVYYIEENKDEYEIGFVTDVSGKIDDGSEEGNKYVEYVKTTCGSYLPELNSTFDGLILDKSGMNYSFYDALSVDYVNGSKRLSALSMISLALIIIGSLLIASNLFFLAFCYIYGRKNNVSPFSETKVNPEGLSRSPHAKKDIFFTPFLAETFFELLGIFLVFFGSLRILYYFFTFLGVITISGNDFQTIPETFFYLFMVGMFLLYFIDFDIFLDEKRVFRNVVLDFLIFIALYVVETLIMIGLKSSDNIILNELESKLTIPNNFGTITCYFLMMLTLFYTPKQIKTDKGILRYRLLTIIPITIIVVNTLIYHFANTVWGWNLSIPVLNLFSSEKTQFSLLCVIYLLGLFFLKLYYEKKYGKEKALALMGGNRFLFAKNSIAALTVFAIGLIEIIFSNSKSAHILGVGKYPNIIYLSPLLLFYHPHKGERNVALDWTTLILYFLSFAGGYLLIALPFVLIIFFIIFK